MVLNFWAWWCPNWAAEMPAIEKVYQDLGDQVALLGSPPSFHASLVPSLFRRRAQYQATPVVSLPPYRVALLLKDAASASMIPRKVSGGLGPSGRFRDKSRVGRAKRERAEGS